MGIVGVEESDIISLMSWIQMIDNSESAEPHSLARGAAQGFFDLSSIDNFSLFAQLNLFWYHLTSN
jgi:hypothetical protein